MLRDALAAFQPQEIGFIADPYPAYDELRRAGRIHFDERTDHWLITRHADVNALLRDRRFGRSYLHLATHEEMGHPPDPELQAPFWHVVRNSVIFAVGLVPLNMALALMLALALSRRFPGVIVFRTVFFAPVVTSAVAWAIVWKFLLQGEAGFINQILAHVGIDGPNWLREPNWAMAAVIVTRVIKMVGLNMILYIAALQSISGEYSEAARLDGANGWQIFSQITWPLLAPTTLVIMVLTTIGSFKVFDHIYLMTNGGPENGTLVLAFYIYQQAFKFFATGYASALAMIMFVLILVLTIIQLLLRRKGAM